MTTDDERREVAERLRELGKLAYSPDNTYELMADALGVDDFEGTDELFARLADLIEPSESGHESGHCPDSVQKGPECDREALLALADELEKCAWYFGLDFGEDEPLRDRLKEASEDFAGCARRIREALGASDD